MRPRMRRGGIRIVWLCRFGRGDGLLGFGKEYWDWHGV